MTLFAVLKQDPSTMDDGERADQLLLLAILLAKGAGGDYFEVFSASIFTAEYWSLPYSPKLPHSWDMAIGRSC